MGNLILGLDVSTSVTGVCILDPGIIPDSKGAHIIYLDRVDFKKCKTLWEKADKIAIEFFDLAKRFPDKKFAADKESLKVLNESF